LIEETCVSKATSPKWKFEYRRIILKADYYITGKSRVVRINLLFSFLLNIEMGIYTRNPHLYFEDRVLLHVGRVKNDPRS
jgi:hypothetical protein